MSADLNTPELSHSQYLIYHELRRHMNNGYIRLKFRIAFAISDCVGITAWIRRVQIRQSNRRRRFYLERKTLRPSLNLVVFSLSFGVYTLHHPNANTIPKLFLSTSRLPPDIIIIHTEMQTSPSIWN